MKLLLGVDNRGDQLGVNLNWNDSGLLLLCNTGKTQKLHPQIVEVKCTVPSTSVSYFPPTLTQGARHNSNAPNAKFGGKQETLFDGTLLLKELMNDADTPMTHEDLSWVASLVSIGNLYSDSTHAY